MKKIEIMKTMSRGFHKAAFKCRKHSPEILVIAGVIGTVASTVMACKATTKLSTVLEEHEKNVEAIHTALEDKDISENYSQEDSKKDLTITYCKTGVELVKLYAPAAIAGAASLTSILMSHRIISRRYAAVSTALASTSAVLKDYRNRVVERIGEEVDRELRYNIKAKQFQETSTDPKTGKEKTETKEVKVSCMDGYSEYARFFDEASRYWEKNAEYNLMFLRAQQSHANDKLRDRGYLFLNEVYDMLDIPPTKEGQIVGWTYDYSGENPNGDNYVDFGIYDVEREMSRDFVNGYERAILLDFNVDGNILDLM